MTAYSGPDELARQRLNRNSVKAYQKETIFVVYGNQSKSPVTLISVVVTKVFNYFFSPVCLLSDLVVGLFACSMVKDVRADCFCASLLRTQIHMPRESYVLK